MKTHNGAPKRSLDSPEEENSPIVNASRLLHFRHRRKLLPANSNPKGSSHILLQLEKLVRFKCSYCEKRNILADEVALDENRQTLQCKKCYERLTRPRMFRPLKIHPSQTYHKWLRGHSFSYDKKKLYSIVKRLSTMEHPLLKYNELGEIPVEAFHPSGSRVASTQNFENIRSIKYMCGIEGGEFDGDKLNQEEKKDVSTVTQNDAKALTEYLKNFES